MASKVKALDLTKITDRAACLRALKKLGYSNPGYDFTRGAKLMRGHNMTFQVAPGNFLVTDSLNHLSFIPMARHIGNLAENANAHHASLMALMVDSGIVPEGTTELPIFGLCVGLAQLAVFRTEGRIVAVSAPESTIEA